MRKILFATERVNVNSRETFMFIGVLLVFAVISSAVVLREGLFDKSRNQFKLVLHCIMIVTSVVPPELPMELSLAVTNSLQALVQGLVYCTEPFRIPFAGRVSILCFDKTGPIYINFYSANRISNNADVILRDPHSGSYEPQRGSELTKSHHCGRS